jgi:hypothetical protein
MPTEEDKRKAAQLKKEVEELRAKRNDPATPKTERARLKLQIETRIWQGQRLDPEQFKTFRWRSSE